MACCCVRTSALKVYCGQGRTHTCSLSEVMHLAVSDPAVDGKGIDVPLRGFHFHLGQEPGVLWEHEEPLLVEFNPKQLPDGHRAGHGEFGHLRRGDEDETDFTYTSSSLSVCNNCIITTKQHYSYIIEFQV